MSETLNSSNPQDNPIDRRDHGWRLAWKLIQLRLRFVVAILSMAMVAVLWPWLQVWVERSLAAMKGHLYTASVSSDSEFFCPMDPGIVTVWPSICPICNMDLIPRKKADAVLLPEGVLARMQLSPYRIHLAGIRTAMVESVSPQVDSSLNESSSESSTRSSTLCVPASAVIQRPEGAIVYVETMKGMFDAVPVELGEMSQGRFRINKGLQATQRVAVDGAFLIDAETRLNPNMATQYFGAAKQLSSSSRPVLPKRSSKSSEMEKSLSEEDQKIVDAQQICPVTEAPLGSMGTPAFVTVKGRKVALCCEGCEERLVADPEKYFSILEKHHAK